MPNQKIAFAQPTIIYCQTEFLSAGAGFLLLPAPPLRLRHAKQVDPTARLPLSKPHYLSTTVAVRVVLPLSKTSDYPPASRSTFSQYPLISNQLLLPNPVPQRPFPPSPWRMGFEAREANIPNVGEKAKWGRLGLDSR